MRGTIYMLAFGALLTSLAGPTEAIAESKENEAVVTGRYDRFRRVIVDLTVHAQFAGNEVVAKEGGRTLGKAKLSTSGKEATGTLVLPMPPIGESYGRLDIAVGEKMRTSVTLTNTELARHEALYLKRLHFVPSYVIDSDNFPICDFEDPAGAEDLIGRYRITLRYLDSEGNDVTRATKPGRYGAIAEIKGESGWTHRRFATLYRTPGRINWQFGGGPKTTCILPETLGINPTTATAQADRINAFVREKTIRGLLSDDDGGAILLAGLHEGTPQDKRDPAQMNDDWWFAQRKRLGLLEGRYETQLPKGYGEHPDRHYPLIVFLHGAGECGLDVKQVRTHGPWKYLAAHPEQECILVGPQCNPYGSQYGTWVGQTREVNDLVDELLVKYRVEPDRVYLTGPSLGGFGAYAIASAHPERFAAVVPICGGSNPKEVVRMKSVPTWAFHGAKDFIVPVKWGQSTIDALKAAGGDARITVYPEAGHECWAQTYDNPDLYKWLFSQKRAAK